MEIAPEPEICTENAKPKASSKRSSENGKKAEKKSRKRVKTEASLFSSGVKEEAKDSKDSHEPSGVQSSQFESSCSLNQKETEEQLLAPVLKKEASCLETGPVEGSLKSSVEGSLKSSVEGSLKSSVEGSLGREPLANIDETGSPHAAEDGVKDEFQDYELTCPSLKSGTAVCKILQGNRAPVLDIESGAKFPNKDLLTDLTKSNKGAIMLNVTAETSKRLFLLRDTIKSKTLESIQSFKDKGYSKGYESNPIWRISDDCIDYVVTAGKPKDNGGKWADYFKVQIPWKFHTDPNLKCFLFKDERGGSLSLNEVAEKTVTNMQLSPSELRFYWSKKYNAPCMALNFQLKSLTVTSEDVYPEFATGYTSGLGEGELASGAAGALGNSRTFLTDERVYRLDIDTAVKAADPVRGGNARFNTKSGIVSIEMSEEEGKSVMVTLDFVDTNQNNQWNVKLGIVDSLLKAKLNQFEKRNFEQVVAETQKLTAFCSGTMERKIFEDAKNEDSRMQLVDSKLVSLLKYPKIDNPNGDSQKISVRDIEDFQVREDVKRDLKPNLQLVLMRDQDGNLLTDISLCDATGEEIRKIQDFEELQEMRGCRVSAFTGLVCGMYLQKIKFGYVTRLKKLKLFEK